MYSRLLNIKSSVCSALPKTMNEIFIIDHFTVACFIDAWPLNESEAGGDIVLIETFLLFLS